MKRISAAMTAMVAFLLIGSVCFGAASGPPEKSGTTAASKDDGAAITLKLPIDSPLIGDYVIAAINDDVITVEELTALLASSHQNRMDKEGDGHLKLDFSEPLKRLINVKLIVQEARNIGLDELPEFKKDIEIFSSASLRQLLMQELSKDVTVDDKAVEKAFTEVAREWKIRSILFDKEENAKKALKAVKAGEPFDDVAGKAQKAGTGKGGDQGQFVKASGLSREVLQTLSTMRLGSTSPVIKVNEGKGFALVKLEDVRVPDDAAERETARKQVLISRKNETLKQYRDVLYRKYAVLDKKLFKALDYESKKPGIEKLLEDKRILAKIAGEKPVTVADLSAAVKEKFFHGVETAIKEKRINTMKQEVLDGIIGKRLFQKEALLRGIDKTKPYQKLVREKEESLLFGLFIQKVVMSNVKFNEEDLKAYYQDHLAEYTYPGMIRLEGLAFNKLGDAESALGKLKKNADFTWIRENAEGQSDKSPDDLAIAGESVVMLKTLPEDMQKALTGAKPGDFRIASGSDGLYYIVSVLELIPARQQTLEEVAQAVAEKVYEIKLNKAVEEWCFKLRNAADMAIYLQTVTTKAY